MKVKTFLSNFSIIFVITLIVSLIVTYLYNLIAHGTVLIDWATAFSFAVIFGVLFPTMKIMEKRKSD